MRVMVAGSSGVIGRQLVPLLLSAGHEVVGLSRSGRTAPEVERSPHAGRLRSLAVDALDRSAVARAVGDAAPDAVVNLVTAIPAEIDPKRMVEQFALTNRLRREGTRNLTDAAVATGVRRVIAESIAYAYEPSNEGPANEDDPLWRQPPPEFAPNLAALREREEVTLDAAGWSCGSVTCTGRARCTPPTARSWPRSGAVAFRWSVAAPRSSPSVTPTTSRRPSWPLWTRRRSGC